MRRSKSNPAKYTRKYSSISQRRMTTYGDVDDAEIDRIKRLMQVTSSKIETSRDDDKDETNNNTHQRNVASDDAEPTYTTDNTALVLTSSRKKKVKPSNEVSLTQEETRAAKLTFKKLSRKLQQLEQRRVCKDRRQELYKTLQKHALTEKEASLMTPSSTLGNQKVTKKEQLRKLLKMERAGIKLSDEQREQLYLISDQEDLSRSKISWVDRKDDSESSLSNKTATYSELIHTEATCKNNIQPNHNKESVQSATLQIMASFTSLKDQKLKTTVQQNTTAFECKSENDSVLIDFQTGPMVQNRNNETQSNESSVNIKRTIDSQNMKYLTSNSFMTGNQSEELCPSPLVQIESKKRRMIIKDQDMIDPKISAEKTVKTSDDHKTDISTSYPSPSFHTMKRSLPIIRPQDVLDSRNNLPVIAMEYEIVDSIRNNHVTILCSETGSGKSTQVPQFLYESGITLGNASTDCEDDGLWIGVTQPRRIAAISTAKRVSYEMGQSDDCSNLSNNGTNEEGNLVSYQTRYENAGIGTRTRIKFMTDGILLQEIKSDLLLRKYAAIILDEAHERNLNTDLLLGLLNATLILRDKTSVEGSLPPLKIVIMSATLRVDDFTKNSKLFQNHPPNVVQVSGRTHPVTIHHTKFTELEKYEDLAFQKVCQIHKKLPQGGILVFLTGQQEITRMVQRLRKALGPSDETSKQLKKIEYEDRTIDDCKLVGPRDMDDDEVDGNIFDLNADSAIENDSCFRDDDQSDVEPVIDNKDSPVDVLVLPLYSLLTASEQAKIFQPISPSTRLIVVSTNISETSLTIPNIKYVVDSGRQKCRNFQSATGIASYDIMWISQASADQRAGRAGRTGPGHCYRLYSSSVYTRQFDPFTLPEILIRPLEEVVLALKSINISNLYEFPFPTAPEKSQLDAAIKLLANLGCIEVSSDCRDGVITKLGEAVSKLPINVRYGKMLIVASDANILDYGIALVAILSESYPFIHQRLIDSDDSSSSTDKSYEAKDDNKTKFLSGSMRWAHKGGDLIATLLAFGAYLHAIHGKVGDEARATRFCKENGLHPVIMQRIHKLYIHLSQLIKGKMGTKEPNVIQSGILMKPPTKPELTLIQQAISSGLLDHVARRAVSNITNGNTANRSKAGYFSCQSSITDQLFIDTTSVLHSRDYRQLPDWVCYDHIVRKTTKAGCTVAVMKNITTINPSWLGTVSIGSNLLKLGKSLEHEHQRHDCRFVTAKYGDHGWIINPVKVDLSLIRGCSLLGDVLIHGRDKK